MRVPLGRELLYSPIEAHLEERGGLWAKLFHQLLSLSLQHSSSEARYSSKVAVEEICHKETVSSHPSKVRRPSEGDVS